MHHLDTGTVLNHSMDAGNISVDDFTATWKDFGFSSTEEEVRTAIKIADTDGGTRTTLYVDSLDSG